MIKILKKILSFFFPFAYASYEEKPMNLTKVTHIGYSYFHRFLMDDGTWVEIETSEEDYRQLGSSDHTDPTIKGGRWNHSCERLKFDTEDGRIRDNQYSDIEGRYQYVKIPDKRECSVPFGEVSDAGVTQEAESLIEKNNNQYHEKTP